MEIKEISEQIATLKRALKKAKNKNKIKSKIADLEQQLKDSNLTTYELARTVLGATKKVQKFTEEEFSKAINRLSQKPKFAFLKDLDKELIKIDLKRKAKPVGWRFKGDNYKRPTKKDIEADKGKSNAERKTYREYRSNRSDVIKVIKLNEGGNLKTNQMENKVLKKILSNEKEYKKIWQLEKDIRSLDKKFGVGATHGLQFHIYEKGSPTASSKKMIEVEINNNNGFWDREFNEIKKYDLTQYKKQFSKENFNYQEYKEELLKDINKLVEKIGKIGGYTLYGSIVERTTQESNIPLYLINSSDYEYALKKAKEKSTKMAHGGGIENENKEMVLNNNKQIAHHTQELQEAVKGKHVPAWVVAKVNRSASDLSDATHYMEGQNENYATGGTLTDDELKRYNELNEKIQSYLLGNAKISSKEMVEHAKLKHKMKMSSNPQYRKQMEWEKKTEQNGEYETGGGVENEFKNLGFTTKKEGDYYTAIYKNGKRIGDVRNEELNSTIKYILNRENLGKKYNFETFATGGGVENNLEEEDFDLFEDFDNLPQDVQDIFFEYEDIDDTYERNEEMLSRLKPLGYTFDYGLDAVPFGLKKMATGGGVGKINKTMTFNEMNVKKGDSVIIIGYVISPDYNDAIEVYLDEYTIHSSGKERTYLLDKDGKNEKHRFWSDTSHVLPPNLKDAIDFAPEYIFNIIKNEIKYDIDERLGKDYIVQEDVIERINFLKNAPIKLIINGYSENLRKEIIIERKKYEKGGGVKNRLNEYVEDFGVHYGNSFNLLNLDIKDKQLVQSLIDKGLSPEEISNKLNKFGNGGVGGTFDSSSTGVGIGGTDSSSQSGEMIGGTMASSMAKGGGVSKEVKVTGFKVHNGKLTATDKNKIPFDVVINGVKASGKFEPKFTYTHQGVDVNELLVNGKKIEITSKGGTSRSYELDLGGFKEKEKQPKNLRFIGSYYELSDLGSKFKTKLLDIINNKPELLTEDFKKAFKINTNIGNKMAKGGGISSNSFAIKLDGNKKTWEKSVDYLYEKGYRFPEDDGTNKYLRNTFRLLKSISPQVDEKERTYLYAYPNGTISYTFTEDSVLNVIDPFKRSSMKRGGIMGDIYSIEDPEQFKQIMTIYNHFTEKFGVDNYFIDHNDDSVVFLRQNNFTPKEVKDMSKEIFSLRKKLNVLHDYKNTESSQGQFKFYIQDEIKYAKGGPTKAQKKKVEKVMHEWKEGELNIGKSDKKVKSQKQAVAIALSQAGLSKKEGGGKIIGWKHKTKK